MKETLAEFLTRIEVAKAGADTLSVFEFDGQRYNLHSLIIRSLQDLRLRIEALENARSSALPTERAGE